MPPKYVGRRSLFRDASDTQGLPSLFPGNRNSNSQPGVSADRLTALGPQGEASSGESRRRAPNPAAKRTRSPIFWKAEKDTPLFKGPLGEPVGQVAEGVVLRELSRYEDPFGGWWFSTRSSDGGVVWLSYYDPESHPMESPGEALWSRVFDTRATPESEQTLKRDTLNRIVFHHPFRSLAGDAWHLSQLDFVELGEGTDEMPSEISLIDFYWKNLTTNQQLSASGGQDEDWNYQYQSLLEDYIFRSVSTELLKSHGDALRNFLDQFQEVVESCALSVIEDLSKSPSDRSFKTHPNYRHVFYRGRMLLRLVMDTPSGRFGGDANAIKVARQHFRSMQFLSSESSKCFLAHPLYAITSFKGHTILAMAIPPVTSEGCLYAPLAAAHSRPSTGPNPCSFNEDHIKDLCVLLGKSLHFKEHFIESCEPSTRAQKAETWSSTLPACSTVYAGRDKRFYLFVAASALPPIPPLVVEKKSASAPGGSPVLSSPASATSALPGIVYVPPSTLLRRMRPEALLLSEDEFNTDTFIYGCYRKEDAEQLLGVGEYIRGHGITAVADTIGFHRPVNAALPLLPAACVLCKREMEREMRLVVCRNPKKCCKICSHCYCKRMAEAFNNAVGHRYAGEEAITKVQFDDAVQCGGVCRRSHALLMEPSISALMHSHGVNMSFLPFVYHRLPFSLAFAVEHFCKVEMCARVAAEVLYGHLASAVGEADTHERVTKFFTGLLSSHGSVAEELWEKEIGPTFMKKYPSLGGPLLLSYVSPELLAERAQETCGVRLSTASLESLITGAAGDEQQQSFIEVEKVQMRTKSFYVPPLSIDAAAELVERLNAWLERVLMFWIGFSTDISAEETYHPFYLRPQGRSR